MGLSDARTGLVATASPASEKVLQTVWTHPKLGGSKLSFKIVILGGGTQLSREPIRNLTTYFMDDIPHLPHMIMESTGPWTVDLTKIMIELDGIRFAGVHHTDDTYESLEWSHTITVDGKPSRVYMFNATSDKNKIVWIIEIWEPVEEDNSSMLGSCISETFDQAVECITALLNLEQKHIQ